MTLIVVVLVIGVVLAIAAVFVGREATRLATRPAPPIYSMDEAYEWVVARVSDEVAATLTPDDVKRILAFQMEFFKIRGAAVNGSRDAVHAPMIVGGAETVDYILERAAATGEAYIPEQVYPVVDTQLAYLRAIGAISTPATPPESSSEDDSDG